MLFQICMTFHLLQNTNENILKNVGNHLVTSDLHCQNILFYAPQKKESHWRWFQYWFWMNCPLSTYMKNLNNFMPFLNKHSIVNSVFQSSAKMWHTKVTLLWLCRQNEKQALEIEFWSLVLKRCISKTASSWRLVYNNVVQLNFESI